MIDKFKKAYLKIINEQANIGDEANEDIQLTFQADFKEGGKTKKTETFSSFDDLSTAVEEWVGLSIENASTEIYDLGADVQADMENYGIDPDSDTAWEDYFKACIDADSTSMILVHDFNADDGDWRMSGNKAVVFSYEVATV